MVSRRHSWQFVLLIIFVIWILALPISHYPLGRDQGEFSTIGRGLLEGKVLNVDLWNPKPPAIFYLYAGAQRLLGLSVFALRVLDLWMYPLVAAAMYWLGRRLGGSVVGLLSAALFGVFYFTETYWTLTQNDGLVILPLVYGIVFTVQAGRTIRWEWAVTAGAAAGMIFWFKYPYALFGVIFAIEIGYLAYRRRGWGYSGKYLIAFAVGGLVVVGGVILMLVAQSAFDDLVEAARVTVQYTALGSSSSLADATVLNAGLQARWQHWWLLIVLGLAWWVIPRFGQGRKDWRLIWLWLLAGLVVVAVQRKGYDYHFLPMLPPMILIGADSLAQTASCLIQMTASQRQYSGSWRIVVVGVTMLLGIASMINGIWCDSWAYQIGQESPMEYAGRFRGGDVEAAESLQVSEYLRTRVTLGDSLFIWGFRPEVYYLSDLRPATRFLATFPLVADWYPPVWREETVETLWAALPPYVLVLRGDYMPWVHGRDEDSNTLLQEFTELNNWLIFNYEQETEIGNFLVWRRKDL